MILSKNWKSGKYLYTGLETAHKSSVTCCTLYNHTVISGEKDAQIVHWDHRRGVVLKVLKGHVGEIIAIRTFGNLLISCCGSKRMTIDTHKESVICVWNIENGKLVNKISNFGVASEMIINSKFIIVAVNDKIIVYTMDGKLKHELKGHKQWISCIKLLNDNLLLSGSYDSTLICWDLESGKSIKNIVFHTVITCLATNGNQIVVGLHDGSIQVLEDFECKQKLLNGKKPITNIAISKNAQFIASTSQQCLVLWEKNNSSNGYKCIELDDSIANCFQMDDEKLVVGFNDCVVKVYSLSDKNCLYTLDNHINRINDLCFNEEILVAASDDLTLSVYDFSPDEGYLPLDSSQLFHLYLVDVNKKVVDAWKKVFSKYPRVKIFHQGFETLPDYDCIVSPANSFGLMDGGVDSVITQQFGLQLQFRVQDYIIKEYQGEQPVGTCFIIPTGDKKHKYLAHTPTMRVPMDIRNTDYVYLAMKALLREVQKFNKKHNNEIKIVACPGLGTLTGQVNADECARQMELAYRNFLQVPKRINWEIARRRQNDVKYGGNSKVEFQNPRRVV